MKEVQWVSPETGESCLEYEGLLSVDQFVLLIYDGEVGYVLGVKPVPVSGAWEMVLLVRLSRSEASDLFLSGDTLVAWPADGLMQGGDPGPERSSMFVSEIAGRPSGLRIRYLERNQAERAGLVVQRQLAEAGLDEEPE
jgi:hypothetical protein